MATGSIFKRIYKDRISWEVAWTTWENGKPHRYYRTLLTETKARAFLEAQPQVKPPPRKRIPVATRFWSKVQKTQGCWYWLGATNSDGYGLFGTDYNKDHTHFETESAHIWAWEQENGPVPKGLELDHIVCDTPNCVRPSHMRACTQRENAERSNCAWVVNSRKTECPKCGQPYDQTTKTGARNCTSCRNEYSREYQRTEKIKEYKREWARKNRPTPKKKELV